MLVLKAVAIISLAGCGLAESLSRLPVALLAQTSGGSTSAIAEAVHEMQSGDFSSARKLLLKSVQENPSDIELWNLLGIAETELQHPDQAKAAFARGLRLEPASVSLNENLGFLLYRQAEYTLAKKYLARAVALGSDKPGVRFSLAAAKLRTGQEHEALAELRQLEKPLESVSDYWQERGRAELALDPASASSSFDRALALAPDNPLLLNSAATAAERQGLDEKALAYLIRARAAHPEDVPTLLHFGMVCLRRDLGPDALTAVEHAHRIDPGNSSALYLLARTNIALQNWRQALELFSDFVKRVPGYAPAYYAMGWLEIKLNRAEDARKQLEHCLSLAPGLFEARYELAQLDLDEGRSSEAEEHLREVLKQSPSHAKANASMGELMMRKGNLDAAQTFLEKAVREDPKLAVAHYKLAMLYFRRHDAQRGETEKATAEKLTQEANRASKVQLRLVLPETLDQESKKR